MSNREITMIIIICFFVVFTTFIIGYTIGKNEVFRDARENGVMTVERGVAGQKIYRWIETHKVGYDYDE
jgi:hypothetical protein